MRVRKRTLFERVSRRSKVIEAECAAEICALVDEILFERDAGSVGNSIIAAEICRNRRCTHQRFLAECVNDSASRRCEARFIGSQKSTGELDQQITVLHTGRRSGINNALEIDRFVRDPGTPPEHHAVRYGSVKAVVDSRYPGGE